MNRILVPCDFSQPALEALRFASDIVAKSKGELYVIKAIDLPISYESAFGIQPYTFDADVLREFRDEAQKQFNKLQKKYGSRGKSKLRFLIEYGSVSSVIRKAVGKHRIDMVVMGTHGASGITGFVIGSNTEKIVRRSPVPVMVVRKAPSLRSIRKITFATTLATGQRKLAEHIKSLQNFFNAKLDVLFVNTPSVFFPSQEINAAMEKYVRQHQLKNYTLHVWNDYNESDGILHYVGHTDTDLLIMPTHGHRGLTHLFGGSVADNIVNTLELPVFTFRLK